MWVICKCCRLRYLCWSAVAEGKLRSLTACSASPWCWMDERVHEREEWKEVMDEKEEKEGTS